MPAEYEVESITQARVAKRSKKVVWEYNVKWKNYGSDENTWEPITSFHGSEDVIERFWARIDMKDRDITKLTQFKLGETFVPVGPPRRKPSQRNLRADAATPAASGSSSSATKEPAKSGKRRRSSPPTVDEDEKPAKRTRGRVSEAVARPAPEPPSTPARRPPAKPTTSTRSIRRSAKKRTPSPDFVPASEEEAEEEDVAMLVDPNPPESPRDELDILSAARNTTNEVPAEPTHEGAPPLRSYRSRATKPLVQMVDDVEPLDGAISAKARLRNGASNNEAAVAGPSTAPRKSARKPGPGRSSAGLKKNTSSLLTFEKGALKTVKGKFTAPVDKEDNSQGNSFDAETAVPPTSDELLKLGGLDSTAAEALDDFEEEVVSPSAESNPNQESLTLAKNKLFPPGTSMASSFSNTAKLVWRRATIFGPLYGSFSLPSFRQTFLSVLFPRGLGSDATADAPSESKPFSLKLDTTVIVPLDLTDVHQSLDAMIKEDGPPGKFFKDINAIKLLDTVRTGGPSARATIRDDATEEHKAHFARFRSRLDQGELFTAMVGSVFLGFSSSETPLMQRLNLPASLVAFSDSIFVTKLDIENLSMYVDVLETADTSRWSA
ncbi:hypothetical protein DFH08DRAFT_224658 [Mycena albidolilacea]|uniref:Chromo domain-containing protein n=1 Tax=Mycena albidolilacea TaxID=1033008 RepID=A0AAD7ENP5_9AGAR|nr:hypothetical protein DFH08DRAFT_224658 [Mycena albidolilacea]